MAMTNIFNVGSNIIPIHGIKIKINLYNQQDPCWYDFGHVFLMVGGFNPFEKYSSNSIIFPNRDENKKYLKPPPR